jgi:hypothetical protein
MADAVKPTIWFYICEDIRQSFLAWDFGQRRGALIMALVNIIALFTLIVSIPLGFGGHEIILTPLALKIIAGIAGGWFIVLLVFITPFRMWREGQVRELLDILTSVASIFDCVGRPTMASYS